MPKFFDTIIEKKVLSCALQDVNALEFTVGKLSSNDFEDANNSYLFDIIFRFYSRYYKSISRDILSTWLTKHAPNKKVELLLLFTDILTIPADGYYRYYCNELKMFSLRRQLYNIHDTLTQGLNDDIEPETLISDLSRKILVSDTSSIVHRTSVHNDTEERIKLYIDKRDYPEKYQGVQYGMSEVDELTGGMFSGQLYMVMARTGGGKCVAEGTQLLMSDGSLVNIEDIVRDKNKNNKILTLAPEKQLITAAPTNYMESGKQDVYRLITKSGRVIDLTSKHPLIATTGWTKLEDLDIGDRIAVPRSLPVFGKSSLSRDDVKLLAYLITAGNLSTQSIGFTNYDNEVRKDFYDVVKYCSVDGISVVSHGKTLPIKKRSLVIVGTVLTKEKTEYGKNKFRKLTINPIKPWLKSFNLLGKKAVDKEIPQEIFKLPEANLAEFLGVLWSCDGSIHGDNFERITFETGSPILTQQVSQLLLRFGILTRYQTHFTEYNGKKFIVGSLAIIGSCRQAFLEKIGKYFIGEKVIKVQKALDLLKTNKVKLNTNVDTIPMSLIYPHLPKTPQNKLDLKKINSKIKFTCNYSKDWDKHGLCRKRVEKLAIVLENSELYKLANSNIFWDEIKSIKLIGPVNTYDIEMEPTRNFVANNIYVHNSRWLFNIGCNVAKRGQSVMYCTIEMEASIIQNMWESRELRLPLKNILRARLSPEDEIRYINFIKNSDSAKIPFYIVDIPQGCTTGMIDAEVATFEKIHGKVPDLVLIDYANLINPISRFKDRAEKYDHVFRELKEGARTHKTPYYTAAQMNRESLKSKEPGTEHVAFSDAASYHCDAVFRVFADKNNDVENDIQFEVIKGRYHEKSCISLYWGKEINLISEWGDDVVQVGGNDGDNDSNTTGSISTGNSIEDDTKEY